MTVEKLCRRNRIGSVRELDELVSSQWSLKILGERSFLTVGLVRKYMSWSLNFFLNALKAGVQRIASPIGEGSQIKILSRLLIMFLRAFFHGLIQ